MELSQKVIVVTGAGSGIGRELTRQLCRKGAVVAALDYQLESLQETADMVLSEGGTISQHHVDVSNFEQVANLPEQVLAEHSHVHGLINNAGIIHGHSRLENLPAEHVERVFNINWWGTYHLTMAFLPLLRGEQQASIVNLSSMGGYMPFPGQVAYGASKAAIKLFTEGLRVELADNSGIKISLVYPGAVQTGISENSPDVPESFKQTVREQMADRQFGVSAEAAAGKIIAGIERGRARILIGKDSWLLDKLYRLMPVLTPALLARVIPEQD